MSISSLRPLHHLRRPARTAAVVTASVAATLTLSVTGQALAQAGHGSHDGPGHAVPAPPAHPTSDAQIQNIDQVRTAIKAYYGDTVTSTLDPVQSTTALHTFDPDGAYARQMHGIVARAERYLAHPGHRHQTSKHHVHHQARAARAAHDGKKAILLDVDDTTLNTYNYEIYSSFVYNPTSNAAFVNSAAFPAVPGMVGLVEKARARGYQVFFLTGRPGTQREGTVENLADVGYPAPTTDHLYLKDYAADSWLGSCAPTCTTIEYKSLTRKHIESQGFDIVANFGDQYSDLEGGYADRTFKLPNPMYYLP